MTCTACGAPRICEGCEMVEGVVSGLQELPPHQEAAFQAFWDAETPEAMRAAYYAMAEVGLPLCNVEPSFGRPSKPQSSHTTGGGRADGV